MAIAVLAEKPSVAKDIAAVLGAVKRTKTAYTGNGYVVTWAVGHLVGLAQPHGVEPAWKAWNPSHLPMLPRQWPLVPLPGTQSHLEAVVGLLNRDSVSEIVCATDAGREGELIFRYIYRFAGCKKPVRRLWISSLTPKAIASGLASLKSSDRYDSLAQAAEARSRADWLVGMNFSRAYSLSNVKGELLSVGRVQTPTLAMIAERDNEIEHFNPEHYCEVIATFGHEPGDSYTGVYLRPSTVEAGEDGRRDGQRRASWLPPDMQEATAIKERCLGRDGVIQKYGGKDRNIPPPMLYDLTELQRDTNRLYGFTAKDTMGVAQSLYEKHKLITYPRTDSRHLSSDVAVGLGAVVEAIAPDYGEAVAPDSGKRPLSVRFVNNKKVTDHHAIIPTGLSPKGKTLSARESKVFDLICRRLLMAWHCDFKTRITEVLTAVGPHDGGVKDLFRTTGTQVVQMGWKVLERKAKEYKNKDGKDGDEARLPDSLCQGQVRSVTDAHIREGQTSPPKRFTDATLLTAMESAGKCLDDRELEEAMKERGLGTPATRAAILETLVTRGYLERKGKALLSTPKGRALVGVVHEDVKSPAMTGEWELALKNVERGQHTMPQFMAKVESYVTSVIGGIFGSPGLGSGTYHHEGQSAPLNTSKVSPPGCQSFPAESVDSTVSQKQQSGPARTGSQPLPPSGRATIPTTSPTGLTGTSGSPSGASVAPHPGLSSRPPQAGSEPPEPPWEGMDDARLEAHLHDVLQRRLGFQGFRPYQREVCMAAVRGEDVLLVMPTGSGKSLCYQLPAAARTGTALVISPLIALMEDQVGKLVQMGFRADRVHSAMSRADLRAACHRYLDGQSDYLFIAPERLGVPGFPEMLAKRQPSLVAIDEAHCISHWGHDFRPDYRFIRERLTLLRPVPMVALTATATVRVQDDIAEQLGLSGKRFIRGFRRENLAVEIGECHPASRVEAVQEILLADDQRCPAIVYVPTRKKAEETAQALSAHLPAAPYHAGMAGEDRSRVHGQFLDGRIQVVVATIAFGMGIDKGDVRTVIHTSLPSSLEAYYQEIGRAGRDGKLARAILLYSFVDVKLHQSFLNRDYPPLESMRQLLSPLETLGPMHREDLLKRVAVPPDAGANMLDKLKIHGAVRVGDDGMVSQGNAGWEGNYRNIAAHRGDQLEEVLQFAQGKGCRMVRLIRHFGDLSDSHPCGVCDCCHTTGCIVRQFRPPTPAEWKQMDSIMSELERYDGQATGTLFRNLSSDGVANRDCFEDLVAALERGGCVTTKEDEFQKDGRKIRFTRVYLKGRLGGYPLEDVAKGQVVLEDRPKAKKAKNAKGLGVTRRKGKGRTEGKVKTAGRSAAVAGVMGSAPVGRSSVVARMGVDSFERASSLPPDPALVERLRGWRLKEARKRRCPAFRILSDKTLLAIVDARPDSLDDLLEVKGVGPVLLKKFGATILDLFR